MSFQISQTDSSGSLKLINDWEALDFLKFPYPMAAQTAPSHLHQVDNGKQMIPV